MSKHIDLHPAKSDPFGRSGVTIDGVYTPFKYGYVDSNGNRVIEPQFDEAEEFCEAICPGHGPLAFVSVNDKKGIIFPSGEYFIEPQFDYIEEFSEGFARVKINWDTFEGDYGYIKPDGTYLVPPIFICASPFDGGFARVKTGPDARIFTLPNGSRILKSFIEISDSIDDDDDDDIDINDTTVFGEKFEGKEGYIGSDGKWYDQIPNSREYDESIIPDQMGGKIIFKKIKPEEEDNCVSSVGSDINSTEKIIDWEERHFQICLALLSRTDLHPHLDEIISTADRMVELLKHRFRDIKR